MNISEKIRSRRIELDLTLEEVARALDVSKSTILKYETGAIQNMGIDKVETLAEILRLSPAYLMGWSDKPTPKNNKEAEQLLDDEKIELIDTVNSLPKESRALAIALLKKLAGRE